MNRPRARDARGAHGAHGDATNQNAAWLATALREQADEHEADLRRIEARFNHLTAAESRRAPRRRPDGSLRPRLRLRLIGVPLGVLAATATATIAVGVTLGIGAHTAHPASQAAASPSQSRTASGQQPAAPGASATPTPVRPAGTASTRDESSPSPSPGPVTATGTVDSHSTRYWTQEDLSVTTTRVVRALQVTVTVSGSTAVQSTGSWSTIPVAYVDTRISPTSGGLRYEITLKPGLTLPPGTYAFGIQFNRPAAGHDFTADTYTVTADTKQASAAGTFTG